MCTYTSTDGEDSQSDGRFFIDVRWHSSGERYLGGIVCGIDDNAVDKKVMKTLSG
jgi:hypothetical protein